MNLIGSNQPLLRKNWRALSYDWNEYQQYSDASCLVCLTERQLAWLQSNVTYYAWSTRWENLGITDEQLSHEAVELELALMSCINIQPYQLEFNYNQAVETALEDYNVLYSNGGIPELNPNTPTDFYSGDGSQERLDALCTATNIYIRSYVANWVSTAQAVLNVTVVIAIALSLTGVGGVIAGTVLAGLAFITQTALDAMQDRGAVDDVACCMYNELIGAVINNALFITSLDNCNFTVGSNQAIIRDIIASDLPQFSNWLSFLNSVGDSFILAQNGIKDCPCGWQYDSDWLTGEEGWFATQGNPPYDAPQSLYVAGVGWTYQDIQTAQFQAYRLDGISYLMPSTYVNSIEMTYDYAQGSYYLGSQTAILLQYHITGGSYVNQTLTFADAVDGVGLTMNTSVNEDIDEIRLLIRISSDGGSPPYVYNGDGQIQSIRVIGIGTNPF